MYTDEEGELAAVILSGVAEEDLYEDELAWKLSARLSDLVGDEWRRATIYVIPDPPGTTSWAGTMLSASPNEVRAALKSRTDTGN